MLRRDEVMSATTALLILVVAWVSIGAISATLMGRRGHAPFTWMFAGAVLGPLVIPVMVASIRHHEETGHSSLPATEKSAREEWGIDVLFGFDGSQESRGALVTAIALFGPHLGRLTIATVLEFGATAATSQAVEADLADVALLAAGFLDRQPETVTLVGRPDEALLRHARGRAFGIVVIAPRGRGASRALFGSVASRLARAPEVPVAIMPAAQRRIVAGGAS